jgi:methylmalonyl-CoA/ethylmalonyl-CoA epimerase
MSDAVRIWTALIGAPAEAPEIVDSQGVEVRFIGSGLARVELLAPTRPDSAVAKFLERHGPGLHHICYRVQDIRIALAQHASEGFELIDHEPRRGAGGHLIAFLHPRGAGGVLVELLELPGHP